MPWRSVIFDLDGTVVNTIKLIIASYDHATRNVIGVPADPAEARSWIGQTLVATFNRLYPDHAEALISAYVEFNLREMTRLVERYPGMDDVLVALPAAGVVCGIATSKRRHSAELTLDSVGLAGLIEVTVAMEDTPVHKPDPAPLLAALARLGVDAEQAVYIGDAVVDVQAARAAGMDAIAVTWGAGTRDELEAAGPLAVVDSVAELRALLLG